MADFGDFISGAGEFLFGSGAKEGGKFSQLDDTQRDQLNSLLSSLGVYGGNAGAGLNALAGQQYNVGQVGSGVAAFNQSGNANDPFNIGGYMSGYRSELDQMLNRIKSDSPILGNAVESQADLSLNAPLGVRDIANPFDEGGYREAVQEGIVDPLRQQTERDIRDTAHRFGGGASQSLGARRIANESRSNLGNQIAGIGLQTEKDVMEKGMQGQMFADQMNISQRNALRQANIQTDMAQLQARMSVAGDFANAQNQFKLQELQSDLTQQQNVSNIANTYIGKYSDFADIASQNFRNQYNVDNTILADLVKGDVSAGVDMQQLMAQNQWNQWNNSLNSYSTILQGLLSGSTAGTYGVTGGSGGSPGLLSSVLSAGIGGLATSYGLSKFNSTN